MDKPEWVRPLYHPIHCISHEARPLLTSWLVYTLSLVILLFSHFCLLKSCLIHHGLIKELWHRLDLIPAPSGSVADFNSEPLMRDFLFYPISQSSRCDVLFLFGADLWMQILDPKGGSPNESLDRKILYEHTSRPDSNLTEPPAVLINMMLVGSNGQCFMAIFM